MGLLLWLLMGPRCSGCRSGCGRTVARRILRGQTPEAPAPIPTAAQVVGKDALWGELEEDEEESEEEESEEEASRAAQRSAVCLPGWVAARSGPVADPS
jgi:hypothetical protein